MFVFIAQRVYETEMRLGFVLHSRYQLLINTVYTYSKYLI